MGKFYFLAMYRVTDNGKTIEDGSFFMQSPQLLTTKEIMNYIRKVEQYHKETINVIQVTQIDERIFKELAGDLIRPHFKIL
jgi:hypothetical protein